MRLAVAQESLMFLFKVSHFPSKLMDLSWSNGQNLFQMTKFSFPDPPFILEKFLSRKTLTEGEDLSIPCTAIGTPKPVLSWIFKNMTLSLSEEYGMQNYYTFIPLLKSLQ